MSARERPHVTELGDDVDFFDLLAEHCWSSISRKPTAEIVMALPEVREDLAALTEAPDAAEIGKALGKVAERVAEGRIVSEGRALGNQPTKGDLSDLMVRPFDAQGRGKGAKDRFRLILRARNGGWTVVAALGRFDDSDVDVAYEQARKRLSRLTGLDVRDLPAGEEHRVIEFVLTTEQRTDLWGHLDVEASDDASLGQFAGEARRFPS